MFLNDLVYFAVWAIFFDRFHELGGFGMQALLLMCGIVAAGFGLTVALGGADAICQRAWSRAGSTAFGFSPSRSGNPIGAR